MGDLGGEKESRAAISSIPSHRLWTRRVLATGFGKGPFGSVCCDRILGRDSGLPRQAGRRGSSNTATERDTREADEQHAKAAHHGKVQA